MELIKKNPYFFSLFTLFVIISGVLLYNMEQGDAIFFFSERRSDFGDVFFTYFTKVGEEWAYPFVLAALLYFIKPRNFRFFFFVPLLGAFVALVSYFSKLFFRHPRPILYFERNGLLEEVVKVADVSLYGGMNSFPSGHTMSAFALYAFFAFMLPNKRMVGALLLLVALLVGISRIYLVQHFLEDVYLGAIIGVGIGMIWYNITVGIDEKWPVKQKKELASN
jgi:membrane-associated phospholipid phosphatase